MKFLIRAVCLWMALAEPHISRAELVVHSGPERVTLVELFSSEGCSSCPPAERWLGTLYGQPRLWREVVPIAFHVDYWDGAGWKDRFARPEYTARQRAYAAAWGSTSVYTPALVVGGKEWKGFPQNEALPKTTGQAGELTARMEAGQILIDFAPAQRFVGGNAHVAWLGLGLISKVQRGENARRQLQHDFVALRHASVAMQHGGRNGWTAKMVDFPVAQEARAVAVWIEDATGPIQAAGREFSQVAK